LLVVGPLLARVHAVLPFQGFLTFAASVLPGALAVFLGVILLVRGDAKNGLLSAAVGLVPIVVLGAGFLKARDVPRINDISTNLDNPPVFVAATVAPENRGKDLGYPDAFKPEVQKGYPGLLALQLPMQPDAAFALARQVATAQPGWTLTRVDAPALTLEGEDTSGIFQFTDDFVIRLVALDGATQVDMRSRSRVGKGDFGANAKRIRTFLAALDAAKSDAGSPPSTATGTQSP
jgi:uncharacterized protein (DUF1499 family)